MLNKILKWKNKCYLEHLTLFKKVNCDLAQLNKIMMKKEYQWKEKPIKSWIKLTTLSHFQMQKEMAINPMQLVIWKTLIKSSIILTVQ